MKRMIKMSQLLAFLLILSVPLFGQSDTEQRLIKKAQVLEDMLDSYLQEQLMDEGSNGDKWRVFGRRGSTEISSYVSENGIYMRVKLNRIGSSIFGMGINPDDIGTINVERNEDGTNQIVVRGKYEGEDFDTEQNNSQEKFEQKLRSTIIDFLRDYTLILSELDDDDIVSIQTLQDLAYQVRLLREQGTKTSEIRIDDTDVQLLASATMKDIRAFASSKIDEQAFEERVKFEDASKNIVPRDLSVFADVLRGLYNRDQTQNYFSSQDAEIIPLGDMGYTLKFKLYSSYRRGNGFDIVAISGQEIVSQQAKDLFVVEEYPKWKEEFLSYLVDYGTTLRSLESTKKLMLEVILPECNEYDNSMPDKVKLEISGETVQALRSSKINRQEAKKQIRYLEIN